MDGFAFAADQPRSREDEAEVAVVGAGPAGCAAAIVLARAGRRVLLLDRTAEARESVCGEFLGPDAAAALARLGLDLPALGAVPLRRLRVAARARDAAVPLPFPAWGLPRRLLDGALREAARDAGVEFRCASVLGAEAADDSWRLRLGGGGQGRAGRVVLATGKHALRGHPRRGAPPGALGLKLHLRGPFPGPETVLLPFDGGYAGLQALPGGGGGANLCAALHGPPGEAARDPGALLARVAAGTALGARLLAPLEPAWARPLAVGGVPYGFRHRDEGGGSDTLYRVGDQAAVIPSFTGSGVAVALHSGLAAAAAILDGTGARRFHADWGRRAAGPMRWAGATAWLLRAVPYLTAAGAAAGPAALLLAARRTRIGVERA
jgi:flavin-dependent dehydrogenase